MMLRVSHRALFAQSLVYGYTCVVQVLEYQSTLFFFSFSFFCVSVNATSTPSANVISTIKENVNIPSHLNVERCTGCHIDFILVEKDNRQKTSSSFSRVGLILWTKLASVLFGQTK